MVAPAPEPLPLLELADAPVPAAPEHSLQPFSAGLMLFLGSVTCNVFAVARLLWLHGKFPKRRPDDPTATQALVGALIPGFNLYWAPFALARLATRLNEQRRECGLPELRLGGLVVAFVVCMIGGSLAVLPLRWLLDDGQLAGAVMIGGPLLNWLLVVPLLGTTVQNGANALADLAQARPAPFPAAFLVQVELKWRARQRNTWGVYLCGIAILHLSVIGLFLMLDRGAGKAQVALLNFSFVTLPLLIGAAALFARASLMTARCARLNGEPRQATAVVAAERRTTRAYQLAWSGVFVIAGLALLGRLVIFEILPHGLNHYILIENILTPLLLLVVPALLVALHLVAQAAQGTSGPPESAAAPVLGLQPGPTPWWPACAGATLVVLLLTLSATWSWFDHRSDRFLGTGASSEAQRPEAPQAQQGKTPSPTRRIADFTGKWKSDRYELSLNAEGRGSGIHDDADGGFTAEHVSIEDNGREFVLSFLRTKSFQLRKWKLMLGADLNSLQMTEIGGDEFVVLNRVE